MESCLYEGHIRHRRFSPIEHEFRYTVFQMFLDLSELDEVFQGRWFWSARRPAPAWFRRKDHLGDPAVPLDTAVRDLVQASTGSRPAGPIRLLTHLRYFGYCMNPVSFYYCFAADGESLETIVAEVHNTPWGERHCYVLDKPLSPSEGGHKRYVFGKAFHVSPFLGMDLRYDWRFTRPGRWLAVHMENLEASGKSFDATTVLRRRPITSRSLSRVWMRYPFMTGQVILAIYWQAFRLWWKRCPFHPHPKHFKHAEAKDS